MLLPPDKQPGLLRNIPSHHLENDKDDTGWNSTGLWGFMPLLVQLIFLYVLFFWDNNQQKDLKELEFEFSKLAAIRNLTKDTPIELTRTKLTENQII